MKHMQKNFDDNCNELMILRWFRDNFVNKNDIKHYYSIAPIILDKINSLPDNSKIYEWIYNYVVEPCVNAIKQNNFEFAYNRYKCSILSFEETFARPLLEERIVKTLRKTI